jgi:drug/metabolite transporter (DMT)-like permease
VSKPTNNAAITVSLLLTVVFWGANNAGTKWLVKNWPPIWTGSTRFLIAGLLLLALLRLTNWLGPYQPLTRKQYAQLGLRGGLSLAAYIIVFCWALKLTAASHVALYIGTSPIWALLIEERPRWDWSSFRRYGAALLAMSGVFVLFWPALQHSTFNIAGEICGLLSSLMWANYNHQSRILAKEVSGLEVAANSMWMSGLILLPIGLIELSLLPQMVALDPPHLGVQLFNILLGGVVPYALWNSALRHWRTSRVMLFNNFIPLSTTTWSHYCLGEPITTTFCTAMALIVAGVLLGQLDWSKIFREPESF